MNLSDILPPLRHFEVIPVSDGGQETYLLRDPQSFADHMLTVSRPVLFCLQFFDGRSQVATLAEAWRDATGGNELPVERLDRIVAELDGVYLLANERSRAHEADLRAQFAAQSTRMHRFGDAGAQVAAALAACYDAAGLPPAASIANESNDLAFLMAPHIDYPRGGAAWGLAYDAARRRFAGEVVVVLGVNHQPHATAVALTRKNFLTPLGEVDTDVALVDEIAAALPFDGFADEFCHRDEHSVELAALALRHAFGDGCPKIVPVLCGSVEEFVQQQVYPRASTHIAAFQDVLRQIVAREGQRLLVLASVDLSHIGPQFGAAEPVSETEFESSLAADRELLAIVGRGDADGFFGAIAADQNARHVCGVAPIHHALACVDGGEALPAGAYGWRAADGSGAVTFGVGGLLRK